MDVRVLAATNRDLPAMVKQGLFREDLFYRLSTITVALPPLRERRTDIDLLARHFVGRAQRAVRFPETHRPRAPWRSCARHDWPGNVRELSHVIEAAMIVCDGPEILPEHLPGPLRDARRSPAAPARPPAGDTLPTLEELERTHIRAALTAAGGHRSETARILGISERNLYRKLKEHGLLT